MVTALKRKVSNGAAVHLDKKHPKTNAVPTAEESETPYQELLRLLADHAPGPGRAEAQGRAVVYWMRMRDLRLSDNRALALACQQAKNQGGAVVVLHVLSPGDYRAHDRSARRIDFVLRNLAELRHRLHELNIPLFTTSIEPRKEIPEKVVELVTGWGASHLFANIEHEVDELRRDIKVIQLARDKNMGVELVHDTCIVEPGKVLTKENKPYSVFSPWQRNWANIVNNDIEGYIGSAAECEPNRKEVRQDQTLGPLFESKVPASIPGFELSSEDSEMMRSLWKAGEGAAQELLNIFIKEPIKSQGTPEKADQKLIDAFIKTPDDSKAAKSSKLESKPSVKTLASPTTIEQYSTLRNRPDLPGTSRLSAYLAAGVISPRACVRASFNVKEKGHGSKTTGKLQVDRRELGVGMWQSELGWRDFYQHVLAAWPRVSMGRAFNEKYDKMVWEHDEEILQKWKDGKTGYPFIDACMRQLKQLGYMHNRGRMCVAMFLTKDLMMDWRLGEKWFMENLVDGDLGSNNGGWQWSASTGTDPQPYFRIFAPLSQSEKSDPDGAFIRQYVPELKMVSGKAIHEPYVKLPKEKFVKLNYPKPIVDHAVARKRALVRYKTPGCADNE